MLLHVVFGQLDADGEALDDEDDARELERDLVGIAPCAWIDEVRSVRAEDDADDGCDGSFADVETFFDEGRAQHEQRGEAAQDDVDQMRSIDREMVPRHGEETVVSVSLEVRIRSLFEEIGSSWYL